MSVRRVALTQGIWGIVNAAAIRLVTFLAQIVLAVLLLPSDFGIYAIAMAVSAIALTIRSAGVAQWQIEGGEREHSDRYVDAFWLALVWNIVLGLCAAALAMPAGHVFHQARVVPLIAVIGLSLPLQTPGTYSFARLQIQLRIKELTVIELTSAVVRSAVMIGCAALGLGSASFVIPIPIGYVVEAAIGHWYVRESPWRHRPNVRRWPRILRQTGWIMAGTIGTAVGLQGDYVTLGALAPIAAVGIYYFAYQLTIQTAGLVASNVNRIFTSVLVSMADRLQVGGRLSEEEPRSQARIRPQPLGRPFLEATTYIMLAGSPVVLLLAAGFEPLEHLVWGAKWTGATAPVLYLSLGLPLYVLATAVQSLVLAEGRFRLWMVFNAIKAVVVVTTALTAAELGHGNASTISAVMAIGLGLAHLTQVLAGLRGSGVKLSQLWQASWIGAIVAPASLIATLAVLHEAHLPALAALVGGPSLMLALYAGAVALARPHSVAAALRLMRGYISPART